MLMHIVVGLVSGSFGYAIKAFFGQSIQNTVATEVGKLKRNFLQRSKSLLANSNQLRWYAR